MLHRLPESLAGILVLPSLLLTVHLLQSKKKKKKQRSFSFVIWKYPQRRSTRGKQKSKENLDSEDQNFHARYSMFPSQTTEETRSSEYWGGQGAATHVRPHHGSHSELSLDEADEKQAHSRSEAEVGEEEAEERAGRGRGVNTPVSWLLGQWLKSQIS